MTLWWKEEESCSIWDSKTHGRKKELRSMNRRVRWGRPYDFPDAYIVLLASLKVGFDAPYRMVEEVVEALSEYISFIQKDICFTKVRRRMMRLLKGRERSLLN
jgi:hypothetical protein